MAASEMLFRCSECLELFTSFAAITNHHYAKTANNNSVDTTTVKSTEENEVHVVVQSSADKAEGTQLEAGSMSVWNQQNTRCLLNLYKDNLDRFQSPLIKKKRIWEDLTLQLNDICRTRFNVAQVEGRWKTVLTAYRKYKDSQNKTGAARKTFDYIVEMDDILGDSHCVAPKFTVSSIEQNTSPKDEDKNEIDTQSEDEPSTSHTSAAQKRASSPKEDIVEKKRKSMSGASQMMSFLQTYTEKVAEREETAERRADERHRESMSILRGLIDVMKGTDKK